MTRVRQERKRGRTERGRNKRGDRSIATSWLHRCHIFTTRTFAIFIRHPISRQHRDECASIPRRYSVRRTASGSSWKKLNSRSGVSEVKTAVKSSFNASRRKKRKTRTKSKRVHLFRWRKLIPWNTWLTLRFVLAERNIFNLLLTCSELRVRRPSA